MSPTLDLITSLTAIGVALASTAVNVRAWNKQPPSVRKGLYLWSAVVSMAFTLVYGLLILGVVDIVTLVDLLIFRALTIMILLGLLFHGWVDA